LERFGHFFSPLTRLNDRLDPMNFQLLILWSCFMKWNEILIFIALLSIAFYAFAIWRIRSKERFLEFFRWTDDPTIALFWFVWVLFLFVVAPLLYYYWDMLVWQDTTSRLLNGMTIPRYFVYLPMYAEFLAAVLFPFQLLGIVTPILMHYVINGFVVFAYAYSAKLMSRLIPEKSSIAPLGLILAPMTIYFLFNGNNHVVMLMFLLLSLLNIRENKYLLGGFFAALSCYKFLMIPPVILLTVVLLFRKGFKDFARFSAGGLIVVAFNGIYYLLDPNKLTRIMENRAALGAHSGEIYRFHFLFGLSKVVDGFESWYIGNEIWFYLVLAGMLIGFILFIIRRLNLLQALAFSYAFVCLFGPEGYRMDPLIGMLWLDAVYREDYRLQLLSMIIIFVDVGVWLQYVHPANVNFDPSFPMFLFSGRGLYLGLAIIAALLGMLSRDDKIDLILQYT
jgi:hypothetical protein